MLSAIYGHKWSGQQTGGDRTIGSRRPRAAARRAERRRPVLPSESLGVRPAVMPTTLHCLCMNRACIHPQSLPSPVSTHAALPPCHTLAIPPPSVKVTCRPLKMQNNLKTKLASEGTGTPSKWWRGSKWQMYRLANHGTGCQTWHGRHRHAPHSHRRQGADSLNSSRPIRMRRISASRGGCGAHPLLSDSMLEEPGRRQHPQLASLLKQWPSGVNRSHRLCSSPDVPAPISYSLASRRKRPVGYSFT